ncbi:L-aspartate oxidase [Microbacterium halotolerans]|uniref:L-aspartate oxidase n=1 Tax=Microbacterium halotolerans TaxID=246613 RepID=UPI0013C3260E|nr:L-aspartate oxidase [Microbacterium halotolerans]
MTRVVVVGSGIAGLTAALEAREGGADVEVLTKAASDASNTRYAQGGIASVVSSDDSAEAHAEDTLRASGGLADPEAVRALVAGGPIAIAALEVRGVGFDRGADGARLLGREAVHSAPRILHAGGDATGAEIQRGLLAECRARGVRVREGVFAADVVVSGGGVVGIRMIDGGSIAEESADAVVLATGGVGQMYAVTTNPQVATGDGVAIALRAGAAVRDMEFVQFHPTVLAVGEPFLVSEAVRGEGAVLLDEAGERFALEAHPDGELAPRDVVARAIARAMARQDGRPVLLDATALGAAHLARRFPTIDRVVRERGLDWSRAPIPVSPAAHYAMGGAVTDLDGRTTVPGLYAAGETARTGVHGANRLASNSLLEGAVFGARAGRTAAAIGRGDTVSAGVLARRAAAASADGASGAQSVAAPLPTPDDAGRGSCIPQQDQRGPDATGAGDPHGRIVDDTTTVGGDGISIPPTVRPAHRTTASRDAGNVVLPIEMAQPFSRGALQELMWRCAGLSRDAKGLAEAAVAIARWRAAFPMPRTAREHEDRNLLDVAAEIVRAASARTESVGAHWRSDDAADLGQPEPALEAAC